MMRRDAFLLVFLAVALATALAPLALAGQFNCTFVNTACPSTATQAGLLRASNDTAPGYDNAHAQLMNDTGTAYNYTLCCVSDANHTLSNNCTNANATVILNLSASENAHVQLPGATPAYNYIACMAYAPGNVTCTGVNGTCPANYTGIASIASSETNSGQYNMTNSHIANYTYYNLSICCKAGNSPPSVPVLNYPANNNNTVFERNITFNWSASTDPDSDPITYDVNLTQTTCQSYNPTGLSTTNWTSAELCVSQVYNWTVRACDPYACSAWAATWNFTILPVMGLTFWVNNTNFGAMNNNQTMNTTTGTPPPFVCANTGNVPLNVTLKALNPLFTSSGLGNSSFQYKARENQTGAFNTTVSQMNWANVTAGYTTLFGYLTYSNNLNNAYVDILLTVPVAEGAGAKSSNLSLQGLYG